MEIGLYSAGDVNTETVRSQRVIRLPYACASAFLSNEVTPRFYFETLYPQIVTDNRTVDCTALHSFFQVVLIVPANGTPSVLNHLPFLLAPRNPIIHNMRNRVLRFHLPLLRNTQAQSTQNSIAAQLGLLAYQHKQYRQINEQKKVDDCLTKVEKWIEPQRFALLLKLCGVARETNLNPIWKRMASAKKSEQVATLRATFDYYKDQLNHPYLTVASNSSILSTMLSLVWAMTTLDAIGTGIQFFQFGDTDLEAAQLCQSEMELMISGTANSSLADNIESLDVKIQLPPSDGSNRNV